MKQKIPALLDEVHRLIELRRLKFILTGSSARSLRRKGTNMPAGRAVTRAMHPLTAHELGRDFDLRWSLAHGGLPVVQVDQDRLDHMLGPEPGGALAHLGRPALAGALSSLRGQRPAQDMR